MPKKLSLTPLFLFFFFLSCCSHSGLFHWFFHTSSFAVGSPKPHPHPLEQVHFTFRNGPFAAVMYVLLQFNLALRSPFLRNGHWFIFLYCSIRLRWLHIHIVYEEPLHCLDPLNQSHFSRTRLNSKTQESNI